LFTDKMCKTIVAPSDGLGTTYTKQRCLFCYLCYCLPNKQYTTIQLNATGG